MSGKRREILERLQRGEISAQEAEQQLQELEGRERGFFRSLCDSLGNLDICLEFGDDHRWLLEEELTGSLSPGPINLELLTHNGSIRVEAWDQPEYRLLVRKRVRARSMEEAEEICRDHQFAQIQGNAIQAGDPQDSRIRRLVSVSLHLQLPRQHPATGTLRTANGSIKVLGLDAQALDLISSNGSISLQDVSGGPIQAKTVNGSIKADGETSLVQASTTNGSIALSSSVLNRDMALSTVNGSIRAKIPVQADTALALKASTTSGRVKLEHSQFDLRSIGGSGGKYIETRSGNWEQALNKVHLEFSTVNGSIAIRES
jgi:hypothetical protein